jgi:CHAT domain-containing protein
LGGLPEIHNKLTSIDFKGQEENEKKVFEWAKEAVSLVHYSKDKDQLALLHFKVAELFNKLTNEIDAPVKHYEIALKIWVSVKGEWNEQVANCYHGLGDIYKYYKFDFYEAEKAYEKALLIRETILFQNRRVLFRNYYSLAATNRSQLDFEKALSYGTKTLEIARELGPLHVETANGMVANIYRDMSDSRLAKKHYLNALALNERTNNLDTRAWYNLSLGETFKNDSSYQEALQYFKKAYVLYKNPQVQDSYLFVNLLINLLDTYSRLIDDINFLRTRTEIFEELTTLNKTFSREASQTWMYSGDHHFRKMQYDSALFYYQRALMASVQSFQSADFSENPDEELIGFRYYVNEILVRKASALKERFVRGGDVGDLRRSISSLRLAEKLLSKQKNTLDLEAAKWQFLEASYKLHQYDLYEDIISNLYAGAEILPKDTVNNLAFQYFEQSKSRTLSDALAQNEQNNQISSQDSLFRLHTELKRQLLSLQEGINSELEKGEASAKISALRENVVDVDKKIQACKLLIEEKYPGYFNVKYGHHTAPLSEVQQIIGKNSQVLLEYFWGNNGVYALGISEEKIMFRRVGDPDSIKATIDVLLAHLADRHSTIGRERFRLFTGNSYKLYKILVEPFKSLLEGRNRMQIIPDGLISQIPFEVLLEGPNKTSAVDYRSLKYLIKSFTIGYAYTSSMMVYNVSKKYVDDPSLLAVGFTQKEPLGTGDNKLEDIIGAAEELKALEKRFYAGKFLVGKDASESNFKSLAPGFDIIHLAIHGMGDTQKNFAASLYFTSNSDSLNDGELHTYELYGLKLKALMAVLSSCESGLGRGYKGEGMVSMASAFTYSGCQNILMSLWKVNDQASIKLMDDFYAGLLAGETIDGALRMAKINYLEASDELIADPKIWAPLVAYGSLDRVFKNGRSRVTLILGISSVILLLSLLVFGRKYYGR